MEEDVVIGDRFLNELDEQEYFRRIDHGMDSLLKGLHRIEGGKGGAHQDNDGVAALRHGHALQGQQSLVLLQSASAKGIFQDNDLVGRLGEFVQKLAVV